jgi:RimJ/RimL family protein N-acetyltransferase
MGTAYTIFFMIDSRKLALRDLTEPDIPLLLHYWYGSGTAYFEAMGVDVAKMPSRETFEQTLRDKIRASATPEGPGLNAVIITYEGRPIGFHTVNPVVPGESGVFHAHLIVPEMRRQGIGEHTYRMATKLFMDRFDLQKIVFKTPAQNAGPNRVKEKLGIRCLGEETVSGFNILRDGLRVRVWELTREEAGRL